MKMRRLDLSDLPRVQQVQREIRCLYVIQEGDDCWFKIGIAGHPVRRLSSLQAGNRRLLRLVAAYAGTDAECCFFEKVALRYFKASAGSEWVCATDLSQITDYLDSFCGVPQ